MYLFLSSTDCKDAHPNNHAWEFTVDIGHYKYLKNKWECALVDIRLPSYKEDVYVFCDVCESSFIGGNQSPVLRNINSRTAISRPIYIPVARDYLSHLRIYIRTRQGEVPTVTSRATTCTLHFRQAA